MLLTSGMSDSVIDSLFEDPLSDSLPGSDLDLFLDQLPASDLSTFPIDIPVGCDDKLIREKDVWDFEPETIEPPKRVKSEILSDGGSPDSSDRYSRGSEDESDELISDSMLNVDIFLNKPGSGQTNLLNRSNITVPTAHTLMTKVSHCLCVTCDFGVVENFQAHIWYVIMKSDRGSRFEKFTNAKLLGSHCIPHRSCRELSGGHFGEEGEEGEPPSCGDLEFDANLTWPNHHLSKDDQLALLYKVDIPVGCDDKLIREKDVWDFEPETIEPPKRVKSEILSDGGSPDSSDRYSRGSEDESDELISDSMLNVDIFLNKPGSGQTNLLNRSNITVPTAHTLMTKVSHCLCVTCDFGKCSVLTVIRHPKHKARTKTRLSRFNLFYDELWAFEWNPSITQNHRSRKDSGTPCTLTTEQANNDDEGGNGGVSEGRWPIGKEREGTGKTSVEEKAQCGKKQGRDTVKEREKETRDPGVGVLKGRDVTEEERKLLEEDGVAIPYNVILTKNEERALKKVRRKIKNKISAAESRKRRKEYIGGLERRPPLPLPQPPTTLKGRDVTEEERKLLEEDGVAIPYNVILTKNEERALKKVRRKIKNKISAAESRKRRKEYIGGLERRVEEHTVVNVKLQKTIDELQKRNRLAEFCCSSG
eukprot:sb/3462877/